MTCKQTARRWIAVAVLGTATALACAQAGELLDNEKLTSLLKNKISLVVIKAKIADSTCQFNSDASEIVKIQQAAAEGGMVQKDIDELLQIAINESKRISTKMRELVSRFLNVCVNAKPDEYDPMLRTLQREGKAIVPYLLEKIEEEDEKKRAGLLDALGKLGDRGEKVVQSVRLMLEDRNPAVRAQAARSLADLNVPEIAKELIESLKQRKEFIDGIALALGYLKDPAATEALTRILDESANADGRVAAAFALGQLRTKDEKALLALLRKGVLDDRNALLRANAAKALAEIGDPRTVDYVKRAYQRFRDGRDDLVRSLGSFRTYDAVDFLIPLTNEDDPKVRLSSIETLKKLTGENFSSYDEWLAWWEINKSRPDWIRAPETPAAPAPKK